MSRYYRVSKNEYQRAVKHITEVKGLVNVLNQKLKSLEEENKFLKEQNLELIRQLGGEIKTLTTPSEKHDGSQSKQVASHNELINERDWAMEKAEQLAQAIVKITGGEIGEHSNYNCPFDNALDLADNYTRAAEPKQVDVAIENALSQPVAQEWQPFDKNSLISKVLNMYGMIDEEQLFRTVKAMRELKMLPQLPKGESE